MFSSPTSASIFSLYSLVFMTTVDLPLSAGRMVILSSFWSCCRAVLSFLVILDLGSLARLMVRTTSQRSSSASLFDRCLATTSVPAMISDIGMDVGVTAKFQILPPVSGSSQRHT